MTYSHTLRLLMETPVALSILVIRVEHLERLHYMTQISARSEVECISSPADLSIGASPKIPTANDSSTCLCSFLDPLTPTSRVTVLSQLVYSSLSQFCVTVRSPSRRRKVLLKSTTATAMAIDTLVGVSAGAGWSLAEQIGGTTILDGTWIFRLDFLFIMSSTLIFVRFPNHGALRVSLKFLFVDHFPK